MRRALVVTVALLSADLVATGALRARNGQPQVPGAFRSNVTMVPLDVRVLDERGNPVTDLRQEDFTVLEDGVKQEIRQFVRRELTPRMAAAGERPALRTASATSPPQDHRLFLIVLGRGRLQGPSKGIDALIDFVQQRLLPQDQVAVLAYNRATDFTTDRRPILEVLARFKAANDAIESRLEHWYSGPPGNAEDRLPEQVQPFIDKLFASPFATRSRQLPPGRIAHADRLHDDFRRGAEELELAGVEPFQSYVSNTLETRQDLGSLYTGIEYLRYLEGEKHLIYISTHGLFLPRVEDDLSLAAMANDARVAIDTVQTGGIYADPPGLRSLSERAWRHTWAISALRNVSDYTGGRAFVYRYGHQAFDALDRMTRTGYLLGYIPKNLIQDGAYRRIEVKVARKKVRLLYRMGYYAREQLIPHDRRQFMTYSRILSAAAFPDVIDDIRVRLDARAREGDSGAEVTVSGTVDAVRIALDRQGAGYTGRLEIAVFALDRRHRLVGERWLALDLALDEAEHEAARRDGIPVDFTFPVRAVPTTLKVVVYDFAADIVGSGILPITRRSP